MSRMLIRIRIDVASSVALVPLDWQTALPGGFDADSLWLIDSCSWTSDYSVLSSDLVR